MITQMHLVIIFVLAFYSGTRLWAVTHHPFQGEVSCLPGCVEGSGRDSRCVHCPVKLSDLHYR